MTFSGSSTDEFTGRRRKEHLIYFQVNYNNLARFNEMWSVSFEKIVDASSGSWREG